VHWYAERCPIRDFDEKHMREYDIFNVCGVIITTTPSMAKKFCCTAPARRTG
jgi:hypothetical protein